MTQRRAFIALCAFSSCYFIPVSKANLCVQSRMKAAEARGWVVAPDGKAIPTVAVSLQVQEHTTSGMTDENGWFWIRGITDSSVWVDAKASGFAPTYALIERIQEPGRNCRRPIHIRLQVENGDCTAISLKKSDLPIAKRELDAT